MSRPKIGAIGVLIFVALILNVISVFTKNWIVVSYRAYGASASIGELYQIASLGEGTDDEFSSAQGFGENDAAFFEPHDLQSLIAVDSMDSLCPLTDAVIGDVAREDAAQIYALVGRGSRSCMKILRNGLEISEMAVSDLPGNPNAVWTVKKNIEDAYDSYIVVSFVNATLALTIGDTVEEASDSGFLPTTPTIGCSMIGDDSLVQIYPEGIRHIRADKRINEWKVPPRRQIVKCAVNRRQVAVALTGGELVYFELDLNGTLNEFTERKLFNADIACMTFSEISEGELNSRFLALGTVDNAVRIISLDPNDMLMPLSTQNLPCPPESILLIDTPNDDGKGVAAVHLNIGLQNGCLFRNTVDNVTGAIMDTRTRYLGTRPVKLFKVQCQGRSAILCTSSRSWLLYHFQRRFHLTPLSYVNLEHAASFCSNQCAEGIVAISASTLRIIAAEKLGVAFNVNSFDHKMTPRRVAVHPNMPCLVTIETDHASYTEVTKTMKRNQMAADVEAMASDETEAQLAQEIATNLRERKLDERVYGAPRAARGKWASAIKLTSAVTGEKLSLFELPQDENAKCLALVQFSKHPDAVMILVGCGVNEILNAQDTEIDPLRPPRGCVYTFHLSPNGDRFDFLHRTETPLPVGAIHDFRGMALVGFGRFLRMYDIGQKKLLAKCENKNDLFETRLVSKRPRAHLAV
uniref:MMS1_N domain-containing protein n=1 Tax=Caenorhabditis japonica TaxID=281687 RepID=A0A8R1HWU0_CAEJA